MKLQKIFESFPILIVLSAVLIRLLPHEPNFAPIGALALFGGMNFKGWKAFAVPILAMVISDLFLGFHSTMIWVYGSFLLIALIGQRVQLGENRGKGKGERGEIGWKKLIQLSLLSSVLFYLITNFGVWITGPMYPRTLAGLGESMMMGLPFLRNTVLGDLTFNAVFFGALKIVWDFQSHHIAPVEVRNK